jgi:hypothetical protein
MIRIFFDTKTKFWASIVILLLALVDFSPTGVKASANAQVDIDIDSIPNGATLTHSAVAGWLNLETQQWDQHNSQEPDLHSPTAAPSTTAPVVMPNSSPTVRPPRPPVPGQLPIIINFQPDKAPRIERVETDFGKEFGPRNNGLFYGWNQDNQINTRIRNEPISPDLAHDTFNHLQKDGQFVWEIALDNGEYYVIVVGGDPSFFDSVIQIQLQGQIIVDGIPTPESPWVTGSGFVTVTDGRLSLTSGEGAHNNKINYIEITGLGFADQSEPLVFILHLPLVSR